MVQKRFLLISPDFAPPLVGGGVVWIYNLVQNCPEEFDVLTASLPKNQTEMIGLRPRLIRKNWIATSNNPPRLRLMASYLGMMGWLILQRLLGRYDTVVVNMCVFGNSLFILTGKLLGLKVIGVAFAEEITTPLYGKIWKDRIHYFLLKHIYKMATGFFSVCDFCRRLLIEVGVSSSVIDVIPPCIDSTRIVRQKKERSPGYKVLSVGRLIERKGFHDLVGAMHRLKPDLPQIHLTIVGDGLMKPILEQEISRLNLHESVLLAGKAADQELADLYQQSDLFVLAHRMLANGDTEGAPTTFCEASAAGLPVIGGTGGGADTMIEEGVNGYIVDTENIEELSDKIRYLLLHPEIARAMGEAGRRKVERDHLPARVGVMLSETLRRLTAEKTVVEQSSKEADAA
ncbi:MAG: glycosyltransferase family 4 protein [Deltaproteobacteria bacterium]|nr:glycosyltransferase family 4 protein [Deltaproteobacteria bacterium]